MSNPNKVLVTYATRAGSTVGVAEHIGQTLVEYGAAVEVKPIAVVDDLLPYTAVIVGSAIRMDRWLPEAVQFVERHQQDLQRRPFAAFVVCLAMSAQGEKRQKQASATAAGYLKPIRALVPTVSEGYFAGALDLKRIPLQYRVLFGLLVASGVFKEGDYRDWAAIKAWARQLMPHIMPEHAQPPQLLMDYDLIKGQDDVHSR